MKLTLALLLILFVFKLNAQPSAQEINAAMGRGINLGNTLEPPREGEWNNKPVQEYYFDDYKNAGFTSVRVPIRWDNYTSKTAPYEVTQQWMNRIEQVVDWGLERGLYIVLNAHHDDWIKTGYDKQSNRDRFDSIWSQIAVRFQNKSEKLLFEIINEPNGLTLANINELNARVLNIIRKTNPSRIVLFSGHKYANSDEMMAASIPNDPYLIGYFHSYDPWSFAGEANGTWGTTSDRNQLKSKFDKVQAWSEKNNIPVTINEFGAIKQFRDGSTTRINDYNSRMYHYAAYVEEALNHNFSFNVWDDGGDFGIYERAQHDWSEVKDILIYTSDKSPTNLKLNIKHDSILNLSWTNRDESIDSIFIERRTDKSEFTKIASLSPDQTSYEDFNLEIEKYYYYKIIYHYNNSTDRPSHPLRSQLKPYFRRPYNGQIHSIPGIIEAEDYDEGGQGLTYSDSDATNRGGAYRETEGVDIQENTNGFHISHIEEKEWIEYTTNVEEAGTYEISASVASIAGGGRLGVSFNNSTLTYLDIPATGSLTKFEKVSAKKKLDEGEQIMRLRVMYLPTFNIDKIEISKTTSSNEYNSSEDFNISSYKAMQVNINSQVKGLITFYDLQGKLLLKREITTPNAELTLPIAGISIYQFIDKKGNQRTGKILIKQ
ncbi:MAG TPA: cellulase family glycosylhydrolase [Prolixibacteraceae bacterium]|nr:cellulase family glycosylhydrolase [Prolixibacteraceae bacterium]